MVKWREHRAPVGRPSRFSHAARCRYTSSQDAAHDSRGALSPPPPSIFLRSIARRKLGECVSNQVLGDTHCALSQRSHKGKGDEKANQRKEGSLIEEMSHCWKDS